MSDYKEWIESLQCGRCIDQKKRTEAHHLKSDLHQSGVSLRANDFLMMPLCVDCHAEFHHAQWGDGRIFDQRGILILTLIRAIKEGVLVIGEVPEW